MKNTSNVIFKGNYAANIKNGNLLFPWRLAKNKILYGFICLEKRGDTEQTVLVITQRDSLPDEYTDSRVCHRLKIKHHHGRWNDIPEIVTFMLGNRLLICGVDDYIEIYENKKKDAEEIRAELYSIVKKIVSSRKREITLLITERE